MGTFMPGASMVTSTNSPFRPRARDLGLPLRGTPGPHNAITDVSGVEVGFATVKQLAARAGDIQVYTGGPQFSRAATVHGRCRSGPVNSI